MINYKYIGKIIVNILFIKDNYMNYFVIFVNKLKKIFRGGKLVGIEWLN